MLFTSEMSAFVRGDEDPTYSILTAHPCSVHCSRESLKHASDKQSLYTAVPDRSVHQYSSLGWPQPNRGGSPDRRSWMDS